MAADLDTPMRPWRWAILAFACGLTACGDVMSPLRKLGTPGEDPYLVFVAQSRDGNAELYVSRPDGRDIRPVTFSPLWESRPVLTPDGDVVAYLRSVDTVPATPRSVWLTNLLNGAERELPVPAGAVVTRLAWWREGRELLGRTTSGAILAWPMPPGKAQPNGLLGADLDSARSAFEVLLGDPPFARIVPCAPDAPAECAQPLNDTATTRVPLADFPVRDAVRWRGDSVAYLIGDSLRVRPLGRGRERRVEWAPRVPEAPRQFTFFPGRARRDTSAQ